MDDSMRMQELHAICNLSAPANDLRWENGLVFASQYVVESSLPAELHDDAIAWSLAAYASVEERGS